MILFDEIFILFLLLFFISCGMGDVLTYLLFFFLLNKQDRDESASLSSGIVDMGGGAILHYTFFCLFSFFAISLNFVIKKIFEKYSVSCPEAYSIFLIPFHVASDIGSFGLGFGFLVFLSKNFVPFVEKRRLMDEVLLFLGVAGISILGFHAVLFGFGKLGRVPYNVSGMKIYSSVQEEGECASMAP